MTPDGSHIYVPCYATNNMVVIDTAQRTIIDSIDLTPAHAWGMHAYDAAIAPDGSKVYLGDDMMDIIAVVSTETHEVTGVIDFGMEGAINSIAVSPNGQFALVAFEGGNNLGVIDLESESVTGHIVTPEEEFFYLVAIASDNNTAYAMSRLHGGRLYVLDVAAMEVRQHLDLEIEGYLTPQAALALSPDDRYLYLTSGFNEGGTEQPDVGINRLFVIDLEGLRLDDQIEIRGGPQRITLSPDGLLAYVSTFSAGKVVIVDLEQRTVLDEFDWGALYADDLDFKRFDLRTVVLGPAEGEGHLVGWDGGILAQLDVDNHTITGAIDLNPMQGVEPVDIVISADGSKAYVPAQGRYPPHYQHTISVIDLSSHTIVKQIPIDGEPMRSVLSPDGSLLYIPTGSSFVAVLDTASDEIVRTFAPNAEPHFYTNAAVHAGQNKLYVSYSSQDGGGGIFVIDMATESLLADIPSNKSVASLAAPPGRNLVFAGRILDPEGLLVIDAATNEVVTSIPPPTGTDYPEVGVFSTIVGGSPDEDHLYWGTGPSFVHVLDLDSLLIQRTIAIFDELLTGLPIAPSGIDFSPDGSLAYISCLDAGYMVVWDNDLNQLVQAVRVGVNPIAATTASGLDYVYVANMLSEDISVIDLATLEVVDTIPLDFLAAND
jgi:YVTN family beta-propeller protein